MNIHHTIQEDDIKEINIAFNNLMGINGDSYAKEIAITGCLSPKSYNDIIDNIFFNGKNSIVKYFGLIHFYHLQYAKFKSLNE